MLGRVSPPMLWRMAEAAGAGPVHPATDRGALHTGCHACGLVQPVAGEHQPGQHCIRCDATLHLRKPDDVSRTWALLIAAALLYIPANLLPVMSVSSVLGASTHTILGGVIQLWAMGSWDLALIVFVASVAVP